MLAMAACGKEPNPSSDVSDGTGEFTASTSADTGLSADSTETAGSGTTQTGKDTGNSGGKTTAKPNTKTTKKRLPNVVPTVSQPIITDPLKVNLKGATIKVYTSYPKDQIGVFNTQKGKSQTGNAYADRLTKIQDTIKCKVQVTVVPADQMVSAAFAAVASGESYGHIMEAPIYNAVSYISSLGWPPTSGRCPTMGFDAKLSQRRAGGQGLHPRQGRLVRGDQGHVSGCAGVFLQQTHPERNRV